MDTFYLKLVNSEQFIGVPDVMECSDVSLMTEGVHEPRRIWRCDCDGIIKWNERPEMVLSVNEDLTLCLRHVIL